MTNQILMGGFSHFRILVSLRASIETPLEYRLTGLDKLPEHFIRGHAFPEKDTENMEQTLTNLCIRTSRSIRDRNDVFQSQLKIWAFGNCLFT